MAKSMTYNNISSTIWECVKATSYSEHGTIYQPAGAPSGTATTDTPIGQVVLSFNYESTKESVSYTIQKKPFIVGDSTIWNGIEETIEHCSSM